jgi:peroxiredoxin
VKSERVTREGIRGPAMLAVGVFVLAAIYAGVRFGVAALDGEGRRAGALVTILRPEYTGNDRLAPDFTLSDRSGRPLTLSSLRGKVVVLHFWSKDCPPCIEELAEALPAYDEMVRGRSDIALVMVSVDEGWSAVSAFVRPSMHAPVLFDPDRAVVERRYGTRLFPETWIIDRDGVIRARFDRTVEWSSAAFVHYVESFL